MAIIPVPNACVNCGAGGGESTTYDFELDIVCVVIAGVPQTAFRREVYDDGVTTVVFVGVDGAILVPDSWAPGDCPCEGGLVFQEILCDDGTDPVTPFLRIYEYSQTGLLESTTDYELDGTTPYVLIGNAVVCSEPVTISGSVEITNDVGNPIPVSGTVCIDDCGNVITVDGTVELGATTLAALETITVLQGTSPWVVSGTVSATSASDHAEDAPHVSGDIGSFALGVRNDTNAILTSTDGDYSPLSTTSSGALNIADAGGSITVDGTVELGATTLAALETVTVLQGTSPWVVSGSVTATISGTVTVTDAGLTTAVVTSVAASVTAVTILASNVNRKEYFIFNDSTYPLRIKYGSGASATDFTYLLAPQTLHEGQSPSYSGIITGIWDTAAGSARVTEVTP